MNASLQLARSQSALAIALALAFTLPAWAQPANAQVPAEIAVDTGEPAAPEQVLAIPAWLDALVRTRVVETTTSRDKRLERLIELLYGPAGLALQYDGATTRTIAQSVTERKANCVSFALMFTALARRAGIDAYVQETDHVLAWQGNGALYGNGHINVGVKIGGVRKTVDIDRSVVSIRGIPRAISDERALAHFYNNRGAELMDAGRLLAARKHLDMAIRMEPDFVGAWNNLGVLQMRQGAQAEAERAYATALEHKKRYAPTLANLVNLYRHTGDTKRLAEYEKQLFEVQRRDPFHQIILALGYERRGNYTAAIEHFQRALRLKAKEHFVYYGLARSYAHLGDTRRAADALVHARDVASDQRDRYQTKLERLRRVHGLSAQ